MPFEEIYELDLLEDTLKKCEMIKIHTRIDKYFNLKALNMVLKNKINSIVAKTPWR